MYWAKHRAWAPVVTALLAMLQVGSGMLAGRLADFASAAMPDGVMSGVPTICCCLRFVWTVLRPLTPNTIAATPKATSTMPAATPPNSRTFFMSPPFERWRIAMAPWSRAGGAGTFGPARNLAAAFPRAACG